MTMTTIVSEDDRNDQIRAIALNLGNAIGTDSIYQWVTAITKTQAKTSHKYLYT